MDDIITSAATMEAAPKENDFDKEAWAAAKQAERSGLYEKADAVASIVAKDPVVLKDYLTTVSRFPSYSVNNTLLIFEQNRDATRVGDYEFWSKKGAQVKRDEKGIAIFEPGAPYERDDGSIGTSYNVKKVFDISQTTTRAKQPKEPDMRLLLTALVTKSNFEIIKVAELPEGINSLYDKATKTIKVRDDLGAGELFKALAVSMAEGYLSRQGEGASPQSNKNSARMVAFVISERYGVPTENFRPALVGLTEGAEPADIKKELSRVQGVVKDVSSRMAENIREAKAPRESSMER